MTKRYTDSAKEILEHALETTQSNMNTVVEPEHLLLGIMETKTMLNRYLSNEEQVQTKIQLNTRIANFGRQTVSSEPQLSYAVATVLKKAEGMAAEFVAVPHIILALLEVPRVAELFKDSAKIKTGISDEIKGKNFNTSKSDDAEDKMSKFAVEVVELARQNKLDPVVERDEEIRQIITILSKRSKSNVIMVGKPGVGKTAIINGIAQLIAKGECKPLENFKIYNVDISGIVAGTSHRGEFEEKLKSLVDEAKKDKKTILFIDEIHMMMGAGKTSDGSMDAANIIKPALVDGSLRLIGATTYDEYRQHITRDPAFERRFIKVNVKEPTPEATVTILRGLREKLEVHHGVKIADKALVYSAYMGKRYIANRRLPDIAIDLIDSACSAAIISLNSEPIEIQQLKNKIWCLDLERTNLEIDMKRDPTQAEALKEVERKIEEAKAELEPLEESYVQERGYIAEARNIKKKIEDAKNRIEQAKRVNDRYTVYDIQNNILPVYEKQLSELSTVEVVITPQNIAEVISSLSGIPMSKLTTKENEKLLNMEANLKRKVFGQDSAISTVVDSLLTSKMGLNRDRKPLASFLFLGPTGVGKTELAKAVCEELNGTCENMVVLDMSDYSSEMSINKLIGAPAGYVGCEQGGTLTEPVKEMPYNVVLLDEVDLAHQSNLNVLYQLLDEGRVTDGRGVKVNFSDTVVVMTSNLGQQFIGHESVDRKSIEELVLRRFGSPLINRIDNVVVFNHLTRDSLASIFYKTIDELNRKLLEKHAKFRVSDAVLNHVITTSANSNYGARIVQRFVRDNFASAIARILLTRKEETPVEICCLLNSEGVEGMVYRDYTFVMM